VPSGFLGMSGSISGERLPSDVPTR
jgi:hypothetical protein